MAVFYKCKICGFEGTRSKLWSHIEKDHGITKDYYMWSLVYGHKGPAVCGSCGKEVEYKRYDKDPLICRECGKHIHPEHNALSDSLKRMFESKRAVFKNSIEVKEKVIELRLRGKSKGDIHQEMKKSYPGISRLTIEEILRDAGLYKDYTHGGYRPGSGKGNKYILNGTIFDSYEELIFYLYHLISKSPVEKCSEPLLNKRGKKYYPDFISKTGEVFEIKSFNGIARPDSLYQKNRRNRSKNYLRRYP